MATTPNDRADYWHVETEQTSTGRMYGSMMRGAGQWFVCISPDGVFHGVAWTDNKDALSVFGAVGADPAGNAAVIRELREKAGLGVPASDAFAQLRDRYRPDTIYSGELADLYDELT